MIQIRELSHSLGGTRVLENVSLTIPDGTIMGLVGINGAGKSTLLRLLAGVYLPDTGNIKYDGISPAKEVARQTIFFLPDDPYFTHETTVGSMLAMYGTFYPLDVERCRQFLTLFHLEENKPLRTFSKGMRRQAYMAIALAIRPKYLLLDEAFDGLDPLARQMVKVALDEMVAEDNSTVLISSHALAEIEQFCDAYTIIDCKTVSSSGEISDRVEQYCKFMLAFADGVTDGLFAQLPVVTKTVSGKFVTAVFAGAGTEIAEALSALSPTVMEELPVDFEEVFLSEVAKGGQS